MELKILSVNRELFSGEVDSINVPSSEGMMTILPNHADCIVNMKHGKLTVKTGSKLTEFEVMGHGTIQVIKNKVIALI